jgi:hypothetical protein
MRHPESVGDQLSAARYPFPPGRPAHFFAGTALGVSPWAVVWFFPIGAAVLSSGVLLAALVLLFARGRRGYGCGALVALLFDILAFALLTLTGLRPI